MEFLAAFFDALDLKTVFGGTSLVLALSAILWKRRQKAHFLAQFADDSLSTTVNGVRVHVAWGGPLNLIVDERTSRLMTGDFERLLSEEIAARDHKLNVFLDFCADPPKGTLVYETDSGRNWKRRLQSEDGRYCLCVWRRA